MNEGPVEPDARIQLSVVCENHEAERGMKVLNPMLREVLKARSAAGLASAMPDRPKNPHFGRLSFSQALA
jgi:hypothetical protein